MKKLFLMFLAFALVMSIFAGCKKEPAPSQPTEPDMKTGLELEENGIIYESLAQKAVVKTALAYLARGSRIQYDDSRLTAPGTPALYRWQYGVRESPEAYTSQNPGYTNCAAFTYDVYMSALDMKIDGYTTAKLTGVEGKQRIYSYYPKGTETDEEKQAVEAEFRANLKMGDLIIIRYNGAKEGNGHAMLYVGSKVLEGVEGYRGTATEGTDASDSTQDTRFNYDIIHSTGSSYKYAERKETYEQKGTVQMTSTDSLFDASTGRYVFGKLKSIVILRPLEIFKREVPENTLNRMKNMDNVVVEKLSSHSIGWTAGPGDSITYQFSITNKNDKEVTITIEDTVSALTTLETFDKTEECSAEGDQLCWKATIPANTTTTISYRVKVKENAKPDQIITADKATVGGVSVPCASVFVARTLSQQEQDNLQTEVTDQVGNQLLRGAELVNALYSKVLKVDNILPDDYEGIMESLFKTFEDESYLNSDSLYEDAVAPGMFGGRNLLQRTMTMDNMSQFRRTESIRTRLPYGNQLVVGDVLIGELGPEETDRAMYLFLGEKMLNLLSGKEIEYVPAQDCLNQVMSYKRFVILRPSMLLNQQQ